MRTRRGRRNSEIQIADSFDTRYFPLERPIRVIPLLLRCIGGHNENVTVRDISFVLLIKRDTYE